MRFVAIAISAVLLVAAWSFDAAAQPQATVPKPAAAVGERWAVLIGVDDYATAQDLAFCGADQRDLHAKLKSCGFAEDHLFLLHDKAAETKYRPSQRNIERELGVVLNLASDDDLLIIAFSGHGISVAGKSYLCPSDAALDDPSTLISLDTIYNRLNDCSAKFKLMLVDACRNDPRPGGTRSLSATEGTKQLARSLQEIKLPQGVVLLNSCAPGEISWEETTFGHGVYMHHVLQALDGDGDANNDGSVSLNELQAFAGTKTKTYVARRFSASQRPFFKLEGEAELMDFALLPTPAGIRRAKLDPRDTRFPARPEIKPGEGWLAADWYLLGGHAIIEGMLKGEAADKAGLRKGDVVVSVAGKKVLTSLSERLAAYQAGDQVSLEIERDGVRRTVAVTLDPLPPDGGTGRLVAAAEAGEAWAMVALGIRYWYGGKHCFADKDHTQAVDWFRKAVEAGSAVGMYHLGLCLHHLEGAQRDLPAARELFLKSATAGHAPAMAAYGLLCEQGTGGPQSTPDAVAWYTKGAELGSDLAQNNLGSMYNKGRGVPVDYAKAMQLFQRAAEQEYSTAEFNVGLQIHLGRGVQQDSAKARGWFELAASHGNANAMYQLGWMHENGHGGAADPVRALEWYKKAAALNQPNAIERLK